MVSLGIRTIQMGTTGIRADIRTIRMARTAVMVAMGTATATEAKVETAKAVGKGVMAVKVDPMVAMAGKEATVAVEILGTMVVMVATVGMPPMAMAERGVQAEEVAEILNQIVQGVPGATVVLRLMEMEVKVGMVGTGLDPVDREVTEGMAEMETTMTGSQEETEEMGGMVGCRMVLAATAATAEMGTLAAMEGMAATVEMAAVAAMGAKAMDR